MANDAEAYGAIMAASIIVSIVMFMFGWFYCSYSKAPQSWPSTEGLVKDKYTSEHELNSLPMAGVPEKRSHRIARGTFFVGKVLYEYELDGKSYSTDNVRRSVLGFGDKEVVKKRLEKYEIGDTIPVYYNPDCHEEAVLETDVYWLSYIPFIFTGIFTSVAIVMGALLFG